MKTIFTVLSFFLILIFCLFIKINDASAQQSNFQIAPSPISYPYFEKGRFDGTAGVSFVSISTDDMNLAGGSANFKGRMAFSEFIALDGDFGLTGMGGSMPGIPPMMPIYSSNGFTPYFIQVDGDADLSFFTFRMAFNIELQPIHSDFGSIILFAGPNINISQFNIDTPFSLIVPPPYTNAGQVYPGYTNTLSISSSLTGWQMGVQLDLDLGSGLRLSPFFMYSSFSGTADMTNSTNASGSSSISISSDIPTSTATSFGMDIIFEDISIGTVLQQLQSAEETDQDTSIILISISYHFSSGEKSPADETESGINTIE